MKNNDVFKSMLFFRVQNYKDFSNYPYFMRTFNSIRPANVLTFNLFSHIKRCKERKILVPSQYESRNNRFRQPGHKHLARLKKGKHDAMSDIQQDNRSC